MVPANMVSLNEDDLVKVITSFQGQKNTVLLWQKDELGLKRHIQEARISMVFKDKREIVVNSDTIFTAVRENSLYIFDGQRQIVFKAEIKELLPLQMTLRFPESLIIPNSRHEERINFLNQKIFMHFSLHKDVKPTDLEEIHKVQVIDVSPNGISFKSSIEKNFGLRNGDRIWIKLYQDEELTEGIVKHLTLMKGGTHEQFLQIGVKF